MATGKSGQLLTHAVRGIAVSSHDNSAFVLTEQRSVPTVKSQQRLVRYALVTILAFSVLGLAGCGGGGSESTGQATATSAQIDGQAVQKSYLAVTGDDYGLVKPTYYYSTINNSFWSIQANVAKSVVDIDSQTVLRIDIQKKDADWPLLNRTFSIEDNGPYVKFPGSFLVFNGKKSTGNKVESGTIAFSPESVTTEYVNGSFDVTITDYDSGNLPAYRYRIQGVFSFKMGDYGPA